MNTINSYIKYNDWMIVNRGSNEPQTGDKVMLYPFRVEIEVTDVKDLNVLNIDDCFVKVPYVVKKN